MCRTPRQTRFKGVATGDPQGLHSAYAEGARSRLLLRKFYANPLRQASAVEDSHTTALQPGTLSARKCSPRNTHEGAFRKHRLPRLPFGILLPLCCSCNQRFSPSAAPTSRERWAPSGPPDKGTPAVQSPYYYLPVKKGLCGVSPLPSEISKS